MRERYVYLTCCVDSTAAAITDMVAAAVPVTHATFVRHCDPRECRVFRTYERHPRYGLTLKNDFMVHYFRAVFRGAPCYYADHSRIEYIWVPPGAAARLRAQEQEDRRAATAAEGVSPRWYFTRGMAGLGRARVTAHRGGAPAGQPG